METFFVAMLIGLGYLIIWIIETLKRIDLVSENGIYHRLKNAILQEAREF
jgi:hypothetical protein